MTVAEPQRELMSWQDLGDGARELADRYRRAAVQPDRPQRIERGARVARQPHENGNLLARVGVVQEARLVAAACHPDGLRDIRTR